MPLNSFLKRAYRNIPLVRELRAIRAELMSLRQVGTFMWQSHLLEDARYGDLKRLLHYSAKHFSQNGEDGQIAEIFRRIGETSRQFVEIGTGDGLENNTALLLAQGWKGWWVEGNKAAVEKIKLVFRGQLAEGQLTLIDRMVTAENIADLLAAANVPVEFDLLSIDIDYNTYYVWQALAKLRPRVAVIEYNSRFPAAVDWKVAYKPDKAWASGSYFGASLKALELLGTHLGYSLVGCDLTGTNAFFVRNDLLADHFATPFTAENHYERLRYGLMGRAVPPIYFEEEVHQLQSQ